MSQEIVFCQFESDHDREGMLVWELFGEDIGLGWDEEKKTIAASDEWWEAKIQVCIIQ